MKLFLFWGDDWGVNAELQKTRSQLNSVHPKIDWEVLYADEVTDINQIHSFSGDMGLFSKDRILLLKGLFSSGSSNLQLQILDYIERRLMSATKSEMPVAIFTDSKVDKRGKLYKLLAKYSESKEFTQPDERAKRVFIAQCLSKYKLKSIGLDIEICDILSGQSLLSIDNEIYKLKMLLDYDQRNELTREDLAVLQRQFSDTIWELFSLGFSDKKAAFSLLDSLLKNEVHFTQVIGYIASQLRQIINYYYYPEKLNPYVRRKLSPLVAKLKRDKLNLLVQKLFDLDLAIKSGDVGPREGLIMYLCLL